MKTKLIPGQKVVCVNPYVKPAYITGVVTLINKAVHIKIHNIPFILQTTKAPYVIGYIKNSTGTYNVYLSKEKWQEEKRKFTIIDKITQVLSSKVERTTVDDFEKILKTLEEL